MMSPDFSSVANEFPDPFRLLIREETGSTNDDLRALADAGAAHGLVVVTKHQTAGRGRRGTAWFAGGEDSLACSVLVRPAAARSMWPRLSLVAGLATARAMERQELHPGIKWPNDVWLDGKKVAGILLEADEDYVIVGIGINVNLRSFPAEIAEIATSMALAGNACFAPAEVLADFITEFAGLADKIEDDLFPEVIREVAKRCVLTGETVSFLAAGKHRTGRVLGIAQNGELVIDGPAGVEKILQADEVRILR